MRCGECGFEFDEMNESQPLCPACGTPALGRVDHLDISALAEDAAELDVGSGGQDSDETVESGQVSDRLPSDLQQAADEAEALLEATGFATFDLPEGQRRFRLPTEDIM
jgi:hypothetical protein